MGEPALQLPPLTVWVDVAAELLGVNLQRAYALIKSGDLPVLPGHGRRRVITAKLESMCARRLTLADIEQAELRLRPKRKKARQSCKRYHQTRTPRSAA